MAALKARSDQLALDTTTTLAVLSDALFTRLRPAPALDWLTDDGLRQCCREFADASRRQL